MKKIVLVAFQFPPYPDVGGFRWGFLVKKLLGMGREIDVITVDWGADRDFYAREYPGARVHVTKSGSPHLLRYKKLKHPFLNALKNAPLKYLDRWFFKSDYAEKWGPSLFKKLDEVVTNDSVIVATGAPFQVNYLLSEYKRRHPSIKLIQDFQDIWSGNPYRKGTLASMWKEQERLSVVDSDAVVAISDTLLKGFLNWSPNRRGEVIENGFDEVLINEVGPKTPAVKTNVQFHVVHLGSITNGRDVPFLKLLESMNADPYLKKNLKVTQVGTITAHMKLKIDRQYSDLIKAGALNFVGRLPQKEALAFLKTADFALLLNSPELLYALSTKIYEYLALGLPVLSLNYGGEIGDFMANANAGLSLNLNEKSISNELIGDLAGALKDFHYDPKVFEKYKYSELAYRYVELIESLS